MAEQFSKRSNLETRRVSEGLRDSLADALGYSRLPIPKVKKLVALLRKERRALRVNQKYPHVIPMSSFAQLRVHVAANAHAKVRIVTSCPSFLDRFDSLFAGQQSSKQIES